MYDTVWCNVRRGADKSLARPGSKQGTATKKPDEISRLDVAEIARVA